MCTVALQAGQVCSTSLHDSTQNGIRQHGQILRKRSGHVFSTHLLKLWLERTSASVNCRSLFTGFRCLFSSIPLIHLKPHLQQAQRLYSWSCDSPESVFSLASVYLFSSVQRLRDAFFCFFLNIISYWKLIKITMVHCQPQFQYLSFWMSVHQWKDSVIIRFYFLFFLWILSVVTCQKAATIFVFLIDLSFPA